MGMNFDEIIIKMAKMYPWFRIIRDMVVVVSFVIGYYNSTLTVEYFAASKAVRETTLLGTRSAIECINQIDVNPCFVGSSQSVLKTRSDTTLLGSVNSFKAWLNPLQMIGMSFLFVAITVALVIIIGTLNTQNKILREFKQKL